MDRPSTSVPPHPFGASPRRTEDARLLDRVSSWPGIVAYRRDAGGARIELDDLAWHEFTRVDLTRASVPYRDGVLRLKARERFDRAPRAQFREESQRRVDVQDRANRGGLHRIVSHCGNRCRGWTKRPRRASRPG